LCISHTDTIATCVVVSLLLFLSQDVYVVSSVRDIPAEERKGKVFIEYFPYDDDKLWMQAWVPRSELIPYNGAAAASTTATTAADTADVDVDGGDADAAQQHDKALQTTQ
jgi:hypothetical protein